MFFLMVLGIVALPGMDMAFVVGSSLRGGFIAGLLALAGSMAGAPQPRTGSSPSATFRQGLLTSVLNPKAYVFVLAVFPQFMRSGARPLWLQMLFMGLIVWGVQAGIYGPLALAAGRTGTGFRARPRLRQFIVRATACVLAAGAVATAIEGWRPL